eukprot:gene1739-1936_t
MATSEKRPLAEQRKYKMAVEALHPLAVYLSHFGTKEFLSNMNIIREIHGSSNGESVTSEDVTVNNDSQQINETPNTENKDLQRPGSNSEEISVNCIKLPLKMLKRGRPKQAGLTVIGLPKKKKNEATKCVPFFKKSVKEKEKIMLNWFVEAKHVNNALKGKTQIGEVCPENVPIKCLDPGVTINQIKKYFTFDGWKCVQSVVSVLEEKGERSCFCFQGRLEDSESIGCDSCLGWMHMACVGLRKRPKSRY